MLPLDEEDKDVEATGRNAEAFEDGGSGEDEGVQGKGEKEEEEEEDDAGVVEESSLRLSAASAVSGQY